jgi:hypothetical protein
MTEDDFRRIENMMTRRIGVMEENVQHKFDLLVQVVVEGQQRLAECVGRMETVMRGMDNQLSTAEGKPTRREEEVDGVAADLSAHRADTEAHRGVYQVREE